MPQRHPKPLTSFCVNCDYALAEALARLPQADQVKVVAATRMMIRVYSAKRGMPMPDEPRQDDVGNVIQLRIPPR